MRRPHNTAIWKAVVKGAARAAFVDAWASYIEENHPEKTRSWSGRNLMDIAPKSTPKAATRFAEKLVKTFEDMNGKTVEQIVRDAGAEHVADDFGYYLYMESVGHGVSWSDNHEEHGCLVPMAEFYMHSLRDVGGHVSERREMARRG